ncbi:MAG: hypothetical protein WCF36_02755 [Candidatus Nanopelagicales bacterium]
MTHPPGPPAPAGLIRRHLPEIGFVAASIIWAAVMIDTGDIVWPLAVWVGTALVPLSLHRRKLRAERTSTG